MAPPRISSPRKLNSGSSGTWSWELLWTRKMGTKASNNGCPTRLEWHHQESRHLASSTAEALEPGPGNFCGLAKWEPKLPIMDAPHGWNGTTKNLVTSQAQQRKLWNL